MLFSTCFFFVCVKTPRQYPAGTYFFKVINRNSRKIDVVLVSLLLNRTDFTHDVSIVDFEEVNTSLDS